MSKGIIFDLDGTLVDSLEHIAIAMNRVLNALGHRTWSLEEYRHFVGYGAEVLVRRALQGNEDVFDEANRAFNQIYRVEMAHASKPFDGIVSVLQTLNQRNIPIAILSNKPHPATTDLVAHAFAHIRFVKVLGHRQDTPLKPDPSSALELAAAMHLPPESILFVGDSEVDMKTALASGMTPVAVSWGMREETELRAAGAANLLSSPHELLALI